MPKKYRITESNLNSKSNLCPNCGSDNISIDLIPIDANDLVDSEIDFEHWFCCGCGHEWIDLNRIRNELKEIRKKFVIMGQM